MTTRAGSRLAAPIPGRVPALITHVEAIAEDVGRLRRHPACEPESSLEHLADRIAGHVETLDCILQPTAADLHRNGLTVDDAIAATDRRARRLRDNLGLRQTA